MGVCARSPGEPDPGLKSVRENGLLEPEKGSFWLKSSKLAPLRGDSKLASWRKGKFSRRL